MIYDLNPLCAIWCASFVFDILVVTMDTLWYYILT